VTTHDRYPLPSILNLSNKLHGCKFFSCKLEDHHEHLRQILTILQENGLQINPAKCVFAAAAMEFLGHRVDHTASGCSRDTYRPLVNFLPLRM
jgi:hypothetical protein